MEKSAGHHDKPRFLPSNVEPFFWVKNPSLNQSTDKKQGPAMTKQLLKLPRLGAPMAGKRRHGMPWDAVMGRFQCLNG